MEEITGKILYDRIESRAKEIGFKDITELCKFTGASRSALSDLNCGRSERLSAKTMIKLAPALKVSADFFTLENPDKEKAPTDEGERKIDDDDIKFALWGTREIDDDVLEQVKAFAKFARENRRDSEDN